jgi:hypothetical protein
MKDGRICELDGVGVRGLIGDRDEVVNDGKIRLVKGVVVGVIKGENVREGAGLMGVGGDMVEGMGNGLKRLVGEREVFDEIVGTVGVERVRIGVRGA